MSTSRNIQSAVNWSKPYMKEQPLDFDNMQPALDTGNMVLQTLFSPPFKWAFNRSSDSFSTAPNQCDYVRNLPDFGYLEDQWLVDGSKTWPLTGAFSLPSATGDVSRPTQIAAQGDDNAGNITFRTKEMPGKIYTIGMEYQRQAPIVRSLATLMGPWPDKFSFLFNWGFLTIASLLVDDSRFPYYEKFFVSRLLGLQGGLSDVDRNLFLGLWSSNARTMLNLQGRTTSANTAQVS